MTITSETFSEFMPRLTAFAKQRLWNPVDVEDAVSGTFCEAWRCRDRFDPQLPLWPWLRAICYRQVCDILRKYRTSETLPEVVDHRRRSSIEDREEYERIAGKVEGLPPEDRQIIELVADGWSTREIGAALNLAHSTVAYRLGRIRGRLSRDLDDRSRPQNLG